ncbi:hypothetical protein WH52_11910 [Tenacibaculum holothuriorum]|uniref:Uncharacterized protein n=1 Tax=Tenacibaculum holothuriorum TaxID=1635173 RepID=A0A1Y2PA69_9FLAO|nr:hypothetical protein [Tenacibaculum holothuriorum]OSY87346.1 hypothetical protein WH52_11910 [Tenacibaculum holothuriorum]
MKNIEDNLNKSIEEETELVNKISLFKYVILYVPLLFLMFAATNLIGSMLFKNVVFDWWLIGVQAIAFSIFFRIFHGIRKLINKN